MKRFKRRSWGWWLILWRKPRFKIKLLKFKTGGSISLQRHKWRHELWLILKGTGTPVCGYGLASLPTALKPVKKGDYMLIEKMKWHKFTALSPTLVLEIQFGELCCEKDIERKDENI